MFGGWDCEAVDIAETCVRDLVCSAVNDLQALLGFHWNVKQSQSVLDCEEKIPHSVFDVEPEGCARELLFFFWGQLFTVILSVGIFFLNNITSLSLPFIGTPEAEPTQLV